MSTIFPGPCPALSLLAASLAVLLASPVAAQTGEGAEVLARVNGEEITRADVDVFIEMIGPQAARFEPDQLREIALDQLITRRVLEDRALATGLDEDPQMQAQIAAQEARLLEEAYLMRQVRARLTEERLREAYEQAVASAPSGEEIRARHILLESEAEAEQVIEALDAGGDFAELAQERSTGPTGAQGGDLGYFTAEVMVPEFSEAAFALEPGTYTQEPVQTSFGWHVIKVEDRRTAEPPPFEDIAPQLSRQLSEQLVGEIIEAERAAADITILEPPADGEASTDEDG